MFGQMDHDYSKRDYLLPPGCKDLVDAINYPAQSVPAKTSHYQNSLLATIHVPEQHVENIAIVADKQQLRIYPKSLDGDPWCERVIDVPAGYNPANAKATYFEGALHILIPKF